MRFGSSKAGHATSYVLIATGEIQDAPQPTIDQLEVSWRNRGFDSIEESIWLTGKAFSE